MPRKVLPARELAYDGIAVAVSLHVQKFSRKPYYNWGKQHVTQDELMDEAYHANALLDGHRDDPGFGYRPLVGVAAAAGDVGPERSTWRICRDDSRWPSPVRSGPRTASVQDQQRTMTGPA